ncbi:hypothetical protein T11_3011 [Trichinella zimbabwensis]|uniref:Uncharacterized protein n=1 Tax=Trichinella zimbabwensis TaxID=268475 RepID=A0A0V1I462_9BILA|nr:hypothetical protein T11_3011 [Trichinella zimbabwensis]
MLGACLGRTILSVQGLLYMVTKRQHNKYKDIRATTSTPRQGGKYQSTTRQHFLVLLPRLPTVACPTKRSMISAGKSKRQKTTDFVRKAYFAYFGIKLEDQDKFWAPHIMCHTCVEQLREWSKKALKSLPFGVPMVWREPQNHVVDCYFCFRKVRYYNGMNRKCVSYLNLPSAIRPVPHGPDVLIPSPPDSMDTIVLSEEESSKETISGSDFEIENKNTPQLFIQCELNAPVRDLDYSNDGTKIESGLQSKHMLAPGTTISWCRKRKTEFTPFFTEEKLCIEVTFLD